MRYVLRLLSALGTFIWVVGATGCPQAVQVDGIVAANSNNSDPNQPSTSFSFVSAVNNVAADNSSVSMINIYLRNGSNQPLSGITPSFDASGTANSYTGCTASDAAGLSSCGIKTTKAETKCINLNYPVSKPCATTVDFIAGIATKLVLVNDVSIAASGVDFSATGSVPQAKITDAYGNLVSTGASSTTTVTITLSGGQWGTISVPAVGGVVSFPAAQPNTTGADTLTLSAGGLSPVVGSSFYVNPYNCDSGNLITGCTFTATRGIPTGGTFKTIGDLTVQTGGLTATPGTTATLSVGGNLYIQSGGFLSGNFDVAATNITISGVAQANGTGYTGGSPNNSGIGTGGGTVTTFGGYASGQGGAMYGWGGKGWVQTLGQTGSNMVTYDTVDTACQLGSGGAGASTAPGGNGGGCMRLHATDTIYDNGDVSADGGSGSNGSAGGSGGKVILIGDVAVTGSGNVTVLGGPAGPNTANENGGGGGGGIIIIQTPAFSVGPATGKAGGSAAGTATVGAGGACALNGTLFAC